MKRDTTPAENARAGAVRDALVDQWAEVRLLCPSGHYVCDATIGVPVVGDRDAAPLWVWPHMSNRPGGPNLEVGGYRFHGFKLAWHHETQSTSVTLRCRNRKCTYRGKVDMFVLAVDAGAAALAGAREYRVTV